MSARIIIDNIRVGELCDDTVILCNIFPYLRTRSQFLLIKKRSGGSRTESSVRVRCKQFRMNNMLPSSAGRQRMQMRSETLPNLAYQKYIDPVCTFNTVIASYAKSHHLEAVYVRTTSQ